MRVQKSVYEYLSVYSEICVIICNINYNSRAFIYVLLIKSNLTCLEVANFQFVLKIFYSAPSPPSRRSGPSYLGHRLFFILLVHSI